MKREKVINWAILIGWMGIIFYMSHQPADISSSQSDAVLKIFAFLGLDLNSYFGELATLIIRKSAHFIEYFILFIFSYRVIKFYVKKEQVKWYAISIVFLYACSDEIHQYFIPRRGPAFKDVLVDTLGGALGVLLSIIYEKKNKRKKS